MAYKRKDAFHARAKAQGYHSRAAFKLQELAKRYRLIRRGDHVVDLGCWPGGWLQVAVDLAGSDGIVVGVDLVPLAMRVAGAIVLCGDARDAGLQSEILRHCMDRVDVVLSDMAPKLTGVRATDEAKGDALAHAALDASKSLLRPGGRLLMKVLMTSELREIRARAGDLFREVRVTKPEASRKASAEMYLVGLDRCVSHHL